MSTLDRRDFLGLAAGTLAGSALAEAPVHVPAGSQHWRDLLIVNALGGLENPNPHPGDDPQGEVSRSDPFDTRVLHDAQASGLTAVNVTIGYVAGDSEPFETTVRDIALLDVRVRAHSRQLLKVLSAADILEARRDHRIGIIYGFQNAAMVGQDATRIELFANLGVRVIQLTYNPANQIGDGSVAPANRGLTAFGREVVERLNANRVMIDLSHSGERTCLDAAQLSRQPVSINHTGCRALVDLPRNKSDQELRLVAARGGFIGIYFMPFVSRSGHATAEDVVAHIDHAVGVCGEDHVGIGTDGTITPIDDLSAYRGHLQKEIAARRAAGISAAGERPDTLPFVIDLRGVDQFYDLASRLQRRGYTSSRIEKILGRNYLRFATQVWGA